jgi:hypothetical protein
MLFTVASPASDAAGPLNRPEACRVPCSELATMPRFAISSVKRASSDLTTAAKPAGEPA